MFFLLLFKWYLWAKIIVNGHNPTDFKRNITGDMNLAPKLNDIAVDRNAVLDGIVTFY